MNFANSVLKGFRYVSRIQQMGALPYNSSPNNFMKNWQFCHE